jgi:hypothetical protein
MPDGTPTPQGGVVLVTPHVDATATQLQFLSSLGADPHHIEILSYIQEPEATSHPSGYRPFTLPLDLPRLFDAVDRTGARLVILDDFIDLLSHDRRWTDQRLAHFLADLNQSLLERHLACLLIRHCPARGGRARPSVLERSRRFLTVAASQLLLARDPMQPSSLLLSHVKSISSSLAPTLVFQIQRHPDLPTLPSITMQGTHTLQAIDFLTHRPEALHRRLLSLHLLKLIAEVTDPIHVSTLYARSPHSSPFQIQRSLKDLLNMGQIEHPARGFYSPAPANPIFSPLKGRYDEVEMEAKRLLQLTLDGITDEEERARIKKDLKYDDPSISFLEKWMRLMRDDCFEQETSPELNEGATTTPTTELNSTDATTLLPELNQRAATTPTTELNSTDATTPLPELNPTDATTPLPELNPTDATTPTLQPTGSLNLTIATTPEQLTERASRQASLDGPEYDRLRRSIPLNGPFPHPAEKIRRDEGHWQL